MGMRRLALGLALTGLWLGSGCAFPVLSGEPRDARAYAYTDKGRERDEEPRGASKQTSTAQRAPRKQASVLSPLAAEPPEPGGSQTPSATCYEELARLHIPFTEVGEDDARGVRWPLRLTGPVGGVTFEPSNKSETHAVLDCRLALALHVWAADLRQRGVVRVEHYSMYRPGARVGGGNRVSGHAHGMAIDAAHFILQDGTRLDVLEDWEGRERGAEPCPMRPDEGFGSRLLRSVTCDAVGRQLFQVIITPHHDKAHQNHVHFELKPDVDWTYVR
jgi:hypothetical protein